MSDLQRILVVDDDRQVLRYLTELLQEAVREPVRGAAIDRMWERMLNGRESFWTVVYEPFMSRDMTRDDLRALISRGLEQTRGSYRILVQMFNMPEADYKRFLNFLRKHDCQMPFQKFRNLSSRGDNGEVAEALAAGRGVEA